MALRRSEYVEPECVTQCVRCCGACVFVISGLLVFTLALQSLRIGDDDDDGPTPAPFESILWSSVAYHTRTWRAARKLLPPAAPPAFP